jgi:hypothetical protein
MQVTVRTFSEIGLLVSLVLGLSHATPSTKEVELLPWN